MLQAVLGLTAERMASAFLTSPAAMTKRRVRVKAKLAGATVRFERLGPDALADRLEPVLDAVYAAFTLARAGEDDGDLRQEAVWLGRLLAELAPGEPEAAGLLALMLFISARPSPVQADRYVPLSHQDPTSWDAALMDEAKAVLRDAGRRGRPGRFQFEAAIQAVHADRRRSGETNWTVILDLYAGLLSVAPTIGSHIAHAAALARSGQPSAAIGALDEMDSARISAHQPYWGRAPLRWLRRAGRRKRLRPTSVRRGWPSTRRFASGCSNSARCSPTERCYPKRAYSRVIASINKGDEHGRRSDPGPAPEHYVWTTRIALAEKGVAHENVPLAPHSPEALAVHLLGKIPVLRHGSVALGEARAIID